MKMERAKWREERGEREDQRGKMREEREGKIEELAGRDWREEDRREEMVESVK